MSIDPLSEEIVTLSESCNHFPRSRPGKKPHVSRIYRYTNNGLKGVVLESIQCGGSRCTSLEAIARFFFRLTQKCKPSGAADSRSPSSTSDAQLEQEMGRIGF